MHRLNKQIPQGKFQDKETVHDSVRVIQQTSKCKTDHALTQMYDLDLRAVLSMLQVRCHAASHVHGFITYVNLLWGGLQSIPCLTYRKRK